MLKHLKTIVIALAILIAAAAVAIPVLASVQDTQQEETVPEVQGTETSEEQVALQSGEKTSKSLSSAAVVGVVAAVGAIAMGLAISKAVEGVARQPEAGDKIQTMLMLGLVFIETAIIYALIVAIMIIFVL